MNKVQERETPVKTAMQSQVLGATQVLNYVPNNVNEQLFLLKEKSMCKVDRDYGSILDQYKKESIHGRQ